MTIIICVSSIVRDIIPDSTKNCYKLLQAEFVKSTSLLKGWLFRPASLIDVWIKIKSLHLLNLSSTWHRKHDSGQDSCHNWIRFRENSVANHLRSSMHLISLTSNKVLKSCLVQETSCVIYFVTFCKLGVHSEALELQVCVTMTN